MLYLHEKKIVYLNSGVILALILIIALVSYQNIDKIAEINRQITDLKNQLELKRASGRPLNQPQPALAAAQKMVESNRSIFLVRGNEYALTQDLEKIAFALSVKQNINLDSTENAVNADLYFLNLTILASGQLDNVMTYLSRLEEMPAKIIISDLTLSPENSSLTLTVKGKIYVKK